MKTIIPYLATTCAVLVAATLADAQFRPVAPIPKPMPIAPITSLPSIERPITSFTPVNPGANSNQSISQQSVSSEQPVRSSSVTVQATPTPDETYHPHEGHHHPEKTPTPAPLMTFGAGERAGERFPETGTRLITAQEAATMNYEQLRYAINEMYARHGADFPKAAITRRFLKDLAGYRPRKGVSLDDIEKEFNQFEYANEQVLAKYKADRWASGER